MPIKLASFRYLTKVSPGIPAVSELEGEVWRNLADLCLPPPQLAGRRIAVTAGSRGIANLKEIVRAVCSWLREHNAKPFVFPAMGSHGGATAEGQRHVLESYGVTEEYVGAPILSSMEIIQVAETASGAQVFMDRNAWDADGVLVLNRVKPHTGFSGKIESGLLKMIAVGMGKRRGAEEVHKSARRHGYEEAIREISSVILATGKVLGGIAIVENEWHQVCRIQSVLAAEFASQEEAILKVARTLTPRIPLPSFRLLIVDRIGKNIAGTGMDTKVIGRGVPVAQGEAPAIDLIYVRDLTPETEGNAVGVGFADIVHERVHRKIDFQKTYMNARTSLNVSSVRLPMCFPSDRAALGFALDSLATERPADQSIVWICSTFNLNRLAISEPLAEVAAGLDGWQVSPERFEPQFDDAGDLIRPQ
jgi:Domain of unknown function (DUF362)